MLPITLVDGKVEKMKSYPSNAEFENWLDMTISGEIKEQEDACCCGEDEGCC